MAGMDRASMDISPRWSNWPWWPVDLGAISMASVLSLRRKRSFITDVEITRKSRVEDRFKVGIKPVDDGTVIDHIAKGRSPEEIWDRIYRIRTHTEAQCAEFSRCLPFR